MSDKPEKPGVVSVGILAGHIKATGHSSTISGHQIKMGNLFHLSFQPDVAQQWIDVLTPIAQEGS